MKEGHDVGFIPSPVKLEALRAQASAARGTKGLYSTRGGSSGNLRESGMPSRGSTPPTPGTVARLKLSLYCRCEIHAPSKTLVIVWWSINRKVDRPRQLFMFNVIIVLECRVSKTIALFLGDDNDSVNIRPGKTTLTTPPAKEKRKNFFKKPVSINKIKSIRLVVVVYFCFIYFSSHFNVFIWRLEKCLNSIKKYNTFVDFLFFFLWSRVWKKN